MYFRILIIALLAGTSYGIINGKDASIKDFPYQVGIEYHDAQISCGGSIISQNWVVSNLWCTTGLKEKPILRAGSDVPFAGGSVHHVDKIIQHEDYNRTSVGIPKNDIVLVHVVEPFQFDETRQPIPMLESDDKLTPGTMANVSGFGYVKLEVDKSSFPEKLQSLEVPIMVADECNEIFMRSFGGLPTEDNICAGRTDNGNVTVNPGYGDQGGPLVVNGRLAGVVSCTCINYQGPVLYTDIAYHRQWIDRHLQLDNNSILNV